MSIICTNCQGKLGCSCQKRTASNGKSVCTLCITGYEESLKKAGVVPVPQKTTKVLFTNNGKL